MRATEEGKISPKGAEETNGDRPHRKIGRGAKGDKRKLRRHNMGERKEFPKGMPVRITGGIYQKGGYVGEIAGSTRCMVYVYVPALKREIRVWHSSVERAKTEAEETTAADPPPERRPSLAEVVARDEQLRTSLADVCVRLARHGFDAGDPDIHKMVDAGLQAVKDIEKEIK
jgi:hypothetical protein